MTSSSTKVTVLIPVLAPREDFLEACLASVLAQTMRGFEVLVVEAASDRPAEATLRRFGDDRIRHVVIEQPTNLVAQLNSGLQHARSALVARMDADDVCLPDRLAAQCAFLEEHPDVTVVGGQIRVIDEDGRLLGHRSYPTRPEEIASTLRRYNCMAHPAVMFRRDVVVDHGGYRYPDRVAQDYELWCRLATNGVRFANLDEEVLEYRLHSDSVKARRVAETLLATVATKREHFGSDLSLLERLRCFGERVAARLPPCIVLWLFEASTYRRPRASSTSPNGPEPPITTGVVER